MLAVRAEHDEVFLCGGQNSLLAQINELVGYDNNGGFYELVGYLLYLRWRSPPLLVDATVGFCGEYLQTLTSFKPFQMTRTREREESQEITSNVQ